MSKSHEVFYGLPKTLRIGPYDVQTKAHNFDEADVWGDWNWTTLTVRFQPDQPSAVFCVDTILHEIGHAIYKIFGVQKNDTEERLTTALATAWTQVFRDNPKLLDWIKGALK